MDYIKVCSVGFIEEDTVIYKTIDLCAGLGGIRRGFEMTGHFKNVLSAEVDKIACLAYKHIFNEDAYNDLTTEEFKNKVQKIQYDILLAGFPCQTFSRAGKQEGFNNKTKGIIFLHILDIIKLSRPKCIFLENVDNLVTHNKGETFKEILMQIDNLNYQIVGVDNLNGDLSYNTKAFIRNSKYFGIPQNRPRIYIVAFDRKYYGKMLLPQQMPEKSANKIYDNLNSLLDVDVDGKFFMSTGYLETLEKHAKREKEKGNGFGYRIVNEACNKNPVANTILATGGSGKERNLIFDPQNGLKYEGKMIGSKKTPINSKYIRVMTPNEWGKLQGFINYAFKKNGKDTFTLPKVISDAQLYKLFGNAVTIPVVECMAYFIYDILLRLDNNIS